MRKLLMIPTIFNFPEGTYFGYDYLFNLSKCTSGLNRTFLQDSPLIPDLKQDSAPGCRTARLPGGVQRSKRMRMPLRAPCAGAAVPSRGQPGRAPCAGAAVASRGQPGRRWRRWVREGSGAELPFPGRCARPRRRRSCLCSCAPGQMGEAILAGKKNMVLFGGCFSTLFIQPDRFPALVRRAGTELCSGSCKTERWVGEQPLPRVLCTTGDTLMGMTLPFDKRLNRHFGKQFASWLLFFSRMSISSFCCHQCMELLLQPSKGKIRLVKT